MAITHKIMAWSECEIEIGTTGANDAMAGTLSSVGTIKDKSSTLEPSDGEVMEAKMTGGHTVAKEVQEGGFTLKTRVIEPDNALFTTLGLGETSNGEFHVKTHLVSGDFSVQVTPKNVGAIGIKAPKCSVAFKPGWSEEEGNFVDLEFEILYGAGGYWYSRFTKVAAGG